jgi:hypothetical protein
MSKLFYYLFFITVPYLFANDLLQLHIAGQPAKLSDEIIAVKDINGRYCAAIQIISDMDGFIYDSYNGVIKIDDKPGQDMVFLEPDERVLQIFHEGYEPLKIILSELGIHLDQKKAWKIKISGEKKLIEIGIVIITKPEGAHITIDGQDRGTGKQHTVTIGNHELKISKAGYQPILQTVYADEKQSLFEYDLKKQQDVNIQITSDPINAMVFFDDVKVGNTPLSTFYPAGRYKIRLEKESYVTYEDYIEIQPQMLTKRYNLIPDYASLKINSTPESNLDVYLNGRKQAFKTPYTIKRILPGTYKIKAKTEFYATEEKEISLKRGEVKEIVLLSTASYATLNIITLPGVTVFLNNKKLIELQNIHLEPSIITLRAEMANTEAVEQRITLHMGDTTTVDLRPFFPTGTIQVAVVPYNAKIELVGQSGSHFSADGANIFSDIPIGTYRLLVSQKGYLDHLETIVLIEGEKVSKSIKLSTIKISNQPFPVVQVQPQKTGTHFSAIAKWGGLVTCVTSLSLSAYYYNEGQKKFQQYENATSIGGALSSYDDTMSYNRKRDICFIAAGASAGCSLIFYYWNKNVMNREKGLSINFDYKYSHAIVCNLITRW